MKTEIYLNKSELSQVSVQDQIAEERELVTKEIALAAKLANDIGMTALAKADCLQLLRPAQERWAKLANLEPLTHEEYNVWCQWLPTGYRTDLLRDYHAIKQWNSYAFDFMPISVRDLIKTVQDQGIFEILEIRTPEKVTIPDPALFGWIGNKQYLLARWGESDENLITFEQVKRGLTARAKVTNRETTKFFSIGLSGFSGLIASIVLLVWFFDPSYAVANTTVAIWWSITALLFVTFLIARFLENNARAKFAYAFQGE